MDIQSKILKFNTKLIAPILTNMFNGILSTFIPQEWKHSFITQRKDH